MPVRNQRGSSLIDQVRHQTELRALEQARRVTWRRLAAVADEYTEWQVFGLWVRAVVEATGSIPAMVAQEMESRTPLLLAGIAPDLDAAVRNGGGPGARTWEDVSRWTEMNFFIAAKQAGWLDAVRYFSSMSLSSMQAWSHWENVDKEWRGTAPMQFPSYPQWRSDVAAVARLANPDSTAQQVLDAVRSVSEAEWRNLLQGFSGLMTFSLCGWNWCSTSRDQPLGSFPRIWQGSTADSVSRAARRFQGSRARPKRVGHRAFTRDCRPRTIGRGFEFPRYLSPGISGDAELRVALSRCLVQRVSGPLALI